MMITKHIHITKRPGTIGVTNVLCGRMAGPLSRTSAASEATCPRCLPHYHVTGAIERGEATPIVEVTHGSL